MLSSPTTLHRAPSPSLLISRFLDSDTIRSVPTITRADLSLKFSYDGFLLIRRKQVAGVVR